MIKLILLLACLGHVFCGITDCMLAYSKTGRFEFSDIKDNEKMKKVFFSMSLKQVELSMMIGIVSLFMACFGYIAISREISKSSLLWGRVMLVSSLFFIVLISAHHVLCGAVEWFYIRLKMTEDARNAVIQFFKRTSFAAIAYIGLLVFDIVLLIFVVSGHTELPRWTCIFNTIPLFLLMVPTKIPAKGNIANAIMFLGLAFLF